MRISDLIRQRGIKPFNASDFEFVTSKITVDHSRLILVGGQALEVWGVLFDVINPTGEKSPLTEDTDWLGGKRDAQWLCDLLGTPESVHLVYAEDFGGSASSAQAFILRPDGRILMMDFLRTIVGPSNEEIKRLAVTVTLKDDRKINVLHPLLCLQSRFANLKVISSKREGNGPLQAKWAISIVESYLKNLVDSNHTKDQIISSCRMVIDIASSDYGEFCWVNYKLDPFDALSEKILSYIGGSFLEKEWPFILQRNRKLKEKWLRNEAEKARKLGR